MNFVPPQKRIRPRRALLVSSIALPLPWLMRRWLLRVFCGYSFAEGARVGRSLLGCTSLRMGEGAVIGHFNIVKGMRVELGEHATVGDFNWISAVPAGVDRHFTTETSRDPALLLGRHAALTARHYVDCCNRVEIGEYATVAGARSQILTHAIDLKHNRQVSAPVHIGRYCFVGTGCVVLKGANLPEFSVLGAGSTLARAFGESYTLYSGVPAQPVKQLDRDSAYFRRERGFVV
jgi:acetyltransferase-like isoleucine patch superfamily enzyme